MATADPVREDLKKAARTRAVRGARDDVAGVRPRHVAAPASTDEVAEVLRVAARHDLTVVPRGAGTTLGWGAPPTRADLVLDTTRITGVVEHAAGDLVVTVRAGTPVSELQAVVAAAGQQLALDTLVPHRHRGRHPRRGHQRAASAALRHRPRPAHRHHLRPG